MNGNIMVISSPSGCGKSTVIQSILKNDGQCAYSISATTRQPRGGEKNGKEYYFLSESVFQDKIEAGAFVEWALVHGNYYGTLWEEVDALISRGKTVLLDIDVQGGLSIRQLRPEAVLLFLMPPSLEELEKRLRNRNTDSEEVIQTRLRNARKEIEAAKHYDYQVVNDDLNEAIASVQAVIHKIRQL